MVFILLESSSTSQNIKSRHFYPPRLNSPTGASDKLPGRWKLLIHPRQGEVDYDYLFLNVLLKARFFKTPNKRMHLFSIACTFSNWIESWNWCTSSKKTFEIFPDIHQQ